MSKCPACGMNVKDDDEECPHCGWKSEKDAKFDCPFCGDQIPLKSNKCPSCGIDLSRLSTKAKMQSIDKVRAVLMSDLQDIESRDEDEERFGCPKCAANLKGDEPKCPGCGQVLLGKAGLRCPVCATPVGKRRKKCPNCSSSLDGLAKQALNMVPLVREPSETSSIEVKEVAGSRACPACGAIVPAELRTCPLCDKVLVVEQPEPKVEQEAEAPEPRPEEQVVQPLPEVVEEVAQVEPVKEPPEERKLESERITTVDFGARPPSSGFSNGLSHVNGRGRINGTGAVNGRAFVNGTGISNGLGPRRKAASEERSSFLSRWQVLVILVAIVVVIPMFLYLSYSGTNERYAIDGDFSEWTDATTYGTVIDSTSPSSNITEWTVAGQGSDLFLYFKTQDPMMSGSEAESYYLFVDSDGSDSTGYRMESIGAEYMIRLTGWDNVVNSSSLSGYSSASDQFDWNAWSSIGTVAYSRDGERIEVQANLRSAVETSARFVLLSKDSLERGSVSHPAPLKGSVLLVEQAPSDEVVSDGIVPRAGSVEMLTVKFTSQGGSGQVDSISPRKVGVSMLGQTVPFSLDKGETKEITITADTSTAANGQLVSVEIIPSSIVSSYASVVINGSAANAYVVLPPAAIVVDGAFADWAGRISADQDMVPVKNPNVDIVEVGKLSTSQSSFFFVGVEGEICTGTFVPALVAKPAGGGGGGSVIPSRHSAEDVLRVFIDSDKSNATGKWVALDSKEIGADQMVEIRGLYGKITSMKESYYAPLGEWIAIPDVVQAAKDSKRIEIKVASSSINNSVSIDFIVETTSWNGRSDLAMFDQSTLRAITRTWVVDSFTTSPYATSMSYQRKLFYDGINYWSFYFDGKDTVHKYSTDDGQTWTFSGRVFTTPGVNETSIWYDSSVSTVYAVGDISSATNNVSIQMGVVDASAHTISWATSDSSLNTSFLKFAGKNTYISKDADGYLWLLSTNWTDTKPLYHDLSAYRSRVVNSIDSWMNTGEILPFGQYFDNSKGSIVPAGSGSDMWAVYTYAGFIAVKRYNGAWPEDWDETVLYKPGGGTNVVNTDNAPPSVVVDGKGILHIVYGTARADHSKRSIPQIEYSHSNSDFTFSVPVNLDPANESLLIGNYFPTISLEESTDSLYVMWLQSDSTLVPKTVMGRKCISGTWYDMTIEQQTTFPKTFLTSVYSISGEYKICWQWTQNVTSPIEVLFDGTMIPEYSDLALPMIGMMVIFAVYRRRVRGRSRLAG